MNINYIHDVFAAALTKIGVEDTSILKFDKPKQESHGDLSTNIAMQLASAFRKNPREVANSIIENLVYDSHVISKVDIAGAGFINISLFPTFYSSQISEILNQGEGYGRLSDGKGIKVNVEYVSANPTGLLHLGHGRNAALGDTISNIYDWLGYEVTREYYFNNAGNQMSNLAKSIYARYMQLASNPDFAFPEDGYHGEYVRTIANELYEKYSDKLIEDNYQNMTLLKKYGEEWCFDKIKNTLERMNINQDVFYNEDSLYKDGKIKDVIEEFKKLDLAYEKDGALWLRLSQMGLDDDRVIVKSSGEPTYRLPDIAYHREKFLRGYDLIVDLFGADHIATVPDVVAGIKALGYDESKMKVIIHQFVTLTENGQQVKMSKRTGKSYTLDDLLEEVGDDVTRFFFIMRSYNTHLEFDLGLAKEQSDKNPVFYLQYAHARICSLFDNAKENGVIVSTDGNLALLNDKYEISLMKQILEFPNQLRLAGNKNEPHILCDYLRELASSFHNFYHHCRILGSEEEIMKARLTLSLVAKTTLFNGLQVLGVSAPEKM